MPTRPLQEPDAERFHTLLAALDGETKNLLFEPGERTLDAAQQRERIRAMHAGAREMVFVAEEAGELVGFLGVRAGEFARNRHVASIVVGVRRHAHRRGVATSLLADATAWMRERSVARVELTVRTSNRGAVALYLRHGFVVEGLRRGALRVDGALVDEYHMGRLLTGERDADGGAP